MKKLKKWFDNISILLKPYWRFGKVYTIIYVLWECIQAPITTMIYVYLMQIVLDQLNAGVTFSTILITIIFFLAIQMLMGIGGNLIFLLYFNPTKENIVSKINIEVYNHIRHTDYQYFDDPDFYDSFTVSYSKYSSIATDTFETFSAALSVLTTIGTLVGYICSSTPYIVIITFMSVILKTIANKYLSQIIVEKDEAITPLNRIKEYLQSTLCSRDNAMDNKCTNIFNILLNKYNDTILNCINVQKSFGKKEAKIAAIENFTDYGATAIIRIIICGLIVLGKVSIGNFVSLLSAANSLAWKVHSVSKYYNTLDKNILYGKKIHEFLSTTSKIENYAKNLMSECLNNSLPFEIKVKNVSFSYKDSHFGLNNININIQKGQKIAIVGENGSGKTTFTKLLLRLYDPDNGCIFINDKSIKDLELYSYRSCIGVAFQDTPIYSLSLKENMSVYCEADDMLIKKAIDSLSINNILEKNNATINSMLTRAFDKNGIMLSGGEKQKLAFARLLTKDFGLLILDEPTAALDPIAEEELNNMIFNKSNTATTILISHRLSNVVHADCIYVFKNGSIVEFGSHDALMRKKGEYNKMFNLQAKNYIKDFS